MALSVGHRRHGVALTDLSPLANQAIMAMLGDN
jgi:hypothetical protein